MKFLIDENVGDSIVQYLTKRGHDIIRARELPFREDSSLVNYAFEENRIIVTNDKDFGFLIYRQMLSSRGVILFRFTQETPSLKVSALEMILSKLANRIVDHFIVASDDKIRIRPLIK
jgi:predicted nuclease of predicted toxin-antitoxin system